ATVGNPANYSVNEGGTLSEPAGEGVLVNDTDAENNTLSAEKLSDPSHGSVTLNSDGSFSYVHDGSASTNDSFTYRACDNGTSGSPPVADPKCSGPVTVSIFIKIAPVNHAPVANSQSVTLDEGASAAIVLTGSDVDGNPLTFAIVTGPTSGTITGFDPLTGALTYTPNPNFHETDSFTFLVNDGTTSSAP